MTLNKYFIIFIITIFIILIILRIINIFNNKPRVVVSLTTSPQRIHYIQSVLDSMSNQTKKPDRIYLNLPKKFLRNNTTFDDLPQFITQNPLIYVNFCDDIGPATKIIPTIYKEHHPDTYILSIDDDIHYPSNMIEYYLQNAHTFTDCVITGCSFIDNYSNTDQTWFNNIPKEPYFNGKLADLVEGFSGVLYKRKFFTNNFLDDFYKHLNEPGCKFGDDFYLSNWLKKYNIKIITLNMHQALQPLYYGLNKDALHLGGNGTTGGNNNNYIQASKYLATQNELYIDYFIKHLI